MRLAATAQQFMKEEKGEDELDPTDKNITLAPPQQWAFHAAAHRVVSG